LYFGEEIIIKSEGETVIKNIPMDSLYFNWNRFVLDRGNLNIVTNIKNFIRVLFDILFAIGALVSVVVSLYNPDIYYLVILAFYVIVGIFDMLVFRTQVDGILKYNNTGIPLSYAIVSIYREGQNIPIIKKVADKYGAYYISVPNGRYNISIDVKNDEGSYTKALYTRAVDIKDGVVNFDIKI
jgi:hypothetical protein